MAKKLYNVTCQTSNSNINGGNVMLAIEAPSIPASKPGEPPVKTAKTVIQIQFTNLKESRDFEPTKKYKVTIEEA